jgi:UDP-N-acetyl-D-mannosaminuronic acid dehydrogenase
MHRDVSKVCVVGLGYIGLPTAALIARSGLPVIGVDIDPAIVSTINSGKIHIVETDLDLAVAEAVGSGRLKAQGEPAAADVFIIAVPTPLRKGKKPDVSHVFAAAKAIAPYLSKGALIILESTSPVGTTEDMSRFLAELRPDLTFPSPRPQSQGADVSLAYCPERVLPGRILKELVENDRCIGGVGPDCSAKARRFYELFVRGRCVETSARTAEMVKLTENAFRDVNIAFANELSVICDQLKIDVWELIALANRHPRVQVLNPGPGVGGHCIAVDPWFIVDAAPGQARLIRTAREVNDLKKHYVLEQVCSLLEAHPGRPALCLGLTFKPNVDDLRESPALEIVEHLALRYGSRIAVVEPFIDSLPETLKVRGIEQKPLEAVLGTNAVVVLLVDHDVFRRIDRATLEDAVLYDTRGVFRESAVPA